MKKLYLRTLALLLPIVALAAPTPPEPAPAAAPPPMSPIDNAVWVLLLLGCVYVFYKRKTILKKN